MIENIKRFVNEHHTLIVVIIGVLVICFIYWFFCCKENPQTEGGDIYVRNLGQGRGKPKCWFIGADVVSQTYPLYLMNDEAHSLFDGTLLKSWKNFYDCYLRLDDEYIMDINFDEMMKYPVFYITKNREDRRPTLMALYPNINDFFTKVYDSDNGGLITKSFEKTKFKFEDFINKEKYKDILTLYGMFVDFIQKYLLHYFDKAFYIGQPATDKYTFNPITADVKSHEIKKDDKDSITGLQLYDKIKTKLRNWYSNVDITIMINHCYTNENGEIQRALQDDEQEEMDHQMKKKEKNQEKQRKGQENEKQKTSEDKETSIWQVADIYPAFKLIKTVFLLLAYSSKYRLVCTTKEKYYKMIASYVVYVQLFNSFCAVKMINTWNKDISNIYVYEREKIKNGRKTESMEPDYDDIARSIGKSLAKHAVPKEHFDAMIQGMMAERSEVEKEMTLFLMSKEKFLKMYDKKEREFGPKITKYCEKFDMITKTINDTKELATRLLEYYKLVIETIIEKKPSDVENAKSTRTNPIDAENLPTFEKVENQISLKSRCISTTSDELHGLITKIMDSLTACFPTYRTLITSQDSQDSCEYASQSLSINLNYISSKISVLVNKYNMFHDDLFNVLEPPASLKIKEFQFEPDDENIIKINWENEEEAEEKGEGGEEEDIIIASEMDTVEKWGLKNAKFKQRVVDYK